MLAIRKKTSAKNQRHAQDCCKIQAAGSHFISHKNHITDPAAVLDTPSTTIQGMMQPNLVQTSFTEKRKVQKSKN